MCVIVRRRRQRIACWIIETSGDGSTRERQVWSFPCDTGMPPRSEAPAMLTDDALDIIARRTHELLSRRPATTDSTASDAVPRIELVTQPPDPAEPPTAIALPEPADGSISTPPTFCPPDLEPVMLPGRTLTPDEIAAMSTVLGVYGAARRDELTATAQRSVYACVHALLRSYLHHQTSLLHGDEDPIVILPDDTLAACG
jgi:hypothetical protein